MTELKDLIGKKVLRIIPFNTGSFNSGYIIKFSGNVFLTAQDGEYGDDAFCFLTGDEVLIKLLETEKRKKEQEEYRKKQWVF